MYPDPERQIIHMKHHCVGFMVMFKNINFLLTEQVAIKGNEYILLWGSDIIDLAMLGLYKSNLGANTTQYDSSLDT